MYDVQIGSKSLTSLTSGTQLDCTHSALCGTSDNLGSRKVYRLPRIIVSQRVKQHVLSRVSIRVKYSVMIVVTIAIQDQSVSSAYSDASTSSHTKEYLFDHLVL